MATFKITAKLDCAGITKGIESLVKRNGTLRTDVHLILNAIAGRWIETGDVRVAVKHVNALVSADLKGLRVNSMKAWIEQHMGFVWVTAGENKNTFVAGKIKAAGLDAKAMADNRWYDALPPEEYKPINDPVKLFKGLVAKFEADRTKAGEQSKVTVEMLEAMKALDLSAMVAQ